MSSTQTITVSSQSTSTTSVPIPRLNIKNHNNKTMCVMDVDTANFKEQQIHKLNIVKTRFPLTNSDKSDEADDKYKSKQNDTRLSQEANNDDHTLLDNSSQSLSPLLIPNSNNYNKKFGSSQQNTISASSLSSSSTLTTKTNMLNEHSENTITSNVLPKELRSLIGISGDKCIKNKMKKIRNDDWLKCRYLRKSKINEDLLSNKNQIILIESDHESDCDEDFDVQNFTEKEFQNNKYIDKIDQYLIQGNTNKLKLNNNIKFNANLLPKEDITSKNVNTSNNACNYTYVGNKLFNSNHNNIYKQNRKTIIYGIDCVKLKSKLDSSLKNDIKTDNFCKYVQNNNIETWSGICKDGHLRPLIIKNIENDLYRHWVLDGSKSSELRSSKPNDNFLHKPVLITGGSKNGWIIVEGQVYITGFEIVSNREMLKLDEYKKKHKITSKQGIKTFIDNRVKTPVLWHLSDAHKYKQPVFIPCKGNGRIGHYVVHSKCFDKITLHSPISSQLYMTPCTPTSSDL